MSSQTLSSCIKNARFSDACRKREKKKHKQKSEFVLWFSIKRSDVWVHWDIHRFFLSFFSCKKDYDGGNDTPAASVMQERRRIMNRYRMVESRLRIIHTMICLTLSPWFVAWVICETGRVSAQKLTRFFYFFFKRPSTVGYDEEEKSFDFFLSLFPPVIIIVWTSTSSGPATPHCIFEQGWILSFSTFLYFLMDFLLSVVLCFFSFLMADSRLCCCCLLAHSFHEAKNSNSARRCSSCLTEERVFRGFNLLFYSRLLLDK